MPSNPSKSVDQYWEYPFPAPVLDIQGDPRTQTPGTLSRMVGIDGRYKGRLRRFPGFFHITGVDLTGGSITFGGSGGAILFEPFAILQGATGTNVVRGILFLGQQSGSDKLFVLYSVNGGAYLGPTAIHTFASPVNFLDMTVDHQLILVVGEDTASPSNKVERLIRFAGTTSGWVDRGWTTQVPSAADLTITSLEESESHLEWVQKYGVAYRLVYPEQGFFGPISVPTTIAPAFVVDATQSCFTRITGGLDITTTFGSSFSRAVLQLFRTVKSSHDVREARGILHLESEWEVPRYTVIGVPLKQTNGTATIENDTDPGYITVNASDVTGIADQAAAGDTLYITASSTDLGFDGVPFRRTITSRSGQQINFEPALPTPLQNKTTLFWGISKDGDGNSSNGVLHTVAADWKPAWGLGTALADTYYDLPLGLDDDALAHQPALDPEEFAVLPKGNPRSKFIREYDDLLVSVTPGRPQEDSTGLDVIRWSRVDRSRKGLLPVLNRRLIADLSDSILSLVSTKSFVVAMMTNGMMRIHRSGSRLALDYIHNQHGSAGRYGTVAVGNTLYIVSPVGILIMDLFSGQLDVVNATQHFFDEAGAHWRDDLADIQVAYDSELGAVIFLNPTKFEMILIWLNYGVVSQLIDVPFAHVRSSPDLQTGGRRRAIFYETTGGALYEIDADRSATSRTTFSYSGESSLTYNGTTTSTISNKLIDGAATFHDNMVGHFVRVRQSDGSWSRARITAKDTAIQLSLDTDIAPSGLRYEVGGIPMQGTMWPLSVQGVFDQRRAAPITELFRMKKVTAMGAALFGVGSSYDASVGPNLKLNYQLFERDVDVAAVEAEGAMDDTQNNTTFAKVSRQHTVLVPGFEQWASNLDFDLLGILVSGTIGKSQHDRRRDP